MSTVWGEKRKCNVKRTGRVSYKSLSTAFGIFTAKKGEVANSNDSYLSD